MNVCGLVDDRSKRCARSILFVIAVVDARHIFYTIIVSDDLHLAKISYLDITHILQNKKYAGHSGKPVAANVGTTNARNVPPPSHAIAKNTPTSKECYEKTAFSS